MKSTIVFLISICFAKLIWLPAANAQISVTSSTNLICPGDSVILTATGGLSYQWSPLVYFMDSLGVQVKAMPTITTTYKVVGTLPLGGKDSATITIYVYPISTMSVTPKTDSVCIGSSIQLIASGLFQTYAWKPGNGLSDSTISNPIASPSGSTVYTVSGTDINGCTVNDSVQLTIVQLPIIQLSSTDTQVCSGDSIVLTANGGIFYTWSPGPITPPIPSHIYATFPNYTTTYTVTGYGPEGCSASESITIKVFPMPLSPTVTLDQNQFLVTDSGYVHYSWYFEGNLITAATGNTCLPDQGHGSYYVIVTDSNGCTATSNLWTFTGLEAITYEFETVKIFPNPTTSSLTVELNLKKPAEFNLEMTDMLGRRVLSKNAGAQAIGSVQFHLETGHLPAGIYLLKAFIGVEILSRKVVVE